MRVEIALDNPRLNFYFVTAQSHVDRDLLVMS